MSSSSDPVPTGSASRREFLQTAGTALAAGVVAPPFVRASDKSGSKHPVVGEGGHAYECHHGWGQLPDHIVWGETHGVCTDGEGLIYIKHLSNAKEPMDSIAVFAPDGRFVRSFGRQFHGGGHGIDLRKEGGEEFLYVCDVKNRQFAKLTRTGEEVWKWSFPKEPGVYQKAGQYKPTNVAFHPDGGFYVADGYGSSYVHQYDRDARWVRTFGGDGTEPGRFKTPHGLILDDRPGREPSLLVADRANARLQHLTLDGEPIKAWGDVSYPAHFDIRGETLLVPDLHARVSIFGGDNALITHLGYDAEWTKKVLANNRQLRKEPEQWVDGRFVHPHDACFDRDGNIFVVEWVPTGRVTFLKKIS